VKAAGTFLVAGVLVLVLAFVAMAALRSGGGSSDVDCDTLHVTPAAWSSASYDRRVELLDDLNSCHRINGRSRDAIVAQLGPPDATAPSELRYDLPYPDSSEKQVLRIYLDDGGLAKSSSVDTPETGAP
jgi:hypothetical protein